MCQALATPVCIKEWPHCPKPSSKKGSVLRMISRKKPRSSTCVTSSLTTTPSIMGSVLGLGERAHDRLKLGVEKLGIHRQRQHLARGALGLGQRFRPADPALIGLLQVNWHRVVDEGADARVAQLREQRVASARAHDVQVEDVRRA